MLNMTMLIQQIIFYALSAVLLFSALMVITVRNSVKSALFLVLAFFASASLWLLLESEFLALVLILVYVGAVMTLFLFVVMTLNLDQEPQKEGFVRYLPYGVLILTMLVALMIYVISPDHFTLRVPLNILQQAAKYHPADFSDTQELGMVLYTRYAYPFEVAGVILLVAIIAAISLSFSGKSTWKKQVPIDQISVKRENRVKLIKM